MVDSYTATNCSSHGVVKVVTFVHETVHRIETFHRTFVRLLKQRNMERTNVAFLLLVALSVLLGGNVAAGFGSDLQTVDTISVVQDQIETDVTDATVDDGALVVTVSLQNPTGYDFQLTGSHFRAFNDTELKLAYASGQRIDDGEDVLAARDSLDVRYRVPLTPAQAQKLETALANGQPSLTGTHSLQLGDTKFTVMIDPVPLSTAGDGA